MRDLPFEYDLANWDRRLLFFLYALHESVHLQLGDKQLSPESDPPNSELAQLCEAASRAGGLKLLEWQGRFQSREKAASDLVTDADIASQEAIQQVIAAAYPNHLFVGEEDAEQFTIPKDRYCWIVDPLDGTTNYVHGYPFYAVSIAVIHGSQIVAGVVYDPVSDNCFRAAHGKGAWLNEVRLHTSTTSRLSESLAAVSFPPQVSSDSPDLVSFGILANKCQAIRRTGSCALNLANVAAGRLDAFWAHAIHPWDVAAGVLLVREAGGVVTNSQGSLFDVWEADFAATANQELHTALIPFLKA